MKFWKKINITQFIFMGSYSAIFNYDKAYFPKMIEEFSEGNSDTLYEILIQYYSHFMNPLKQSQNFYNDFVKYALKKEKDLKNFKLINTKLC